MRETKSLIYIVNKDDREDPGNYKRITLLSVVGRVFVKHLTIDWYSVWIKECCTKGNLALS